MDSAEGGHGVAVTDASGFGEGDLLGGRRGDRSASLPAPAVDVERAPDGLHQWPAQRSAQWSEQVGDGPLGRSLRLHEARSRLGHTFSDMEAEVEGALGRGEFLLLYQPRFSLATYDVVAIEALLRWRDPARGLLGPAAFLPLISQTSVMIALGRWVLQEAALEASGWEQGRPTGVAPVFLSVNVAAREILDPAFIDTTLAILDDCCLPISLIQLEIDASDALRHETDVVVKLRQLRRLGLRVAIDGASPTLGAGSDRLAADAVHLQRLWLRGLGSDPELSDAIAALAVRVHRSGALLCAMGVEHQAQADALAAVGCDHAQGFALCDPVAPTDLGWIAP